MFGNAGKYKDAGIPVGDQNIEFTKKYLATEGIPITKIDVGGERARKIYFDPSNGFVKLFRLGSDEKIIEREVQYHSKIKPTIIQIKKSDDDDDSLDSKITLF